MHLALLIFVEYIDEQSAASVPVQSEGVSRVQYAFRMKKRVSTALINIELCVDPEAFPAKPIASECSDQQADTHNPSEYRSDRCAMGVKPPPNCTLYTLYDFALAKTQSGAPVAQCLHE